MLSLIHETCEYNKSLLFQFVFIVGVITGQWILLLLFKNVKKLFVWLATVKELGPDTFI